MGKDVENTKNMNLTSEQWAKHPYFVEIHNCSNNYTNQETGLNQFIPFSTYTRVSNFGQNSSFRMTVRLIRGATYTRVYTVIEFPF